MLLIQINYHFKHDFAKSELILEKSRSGAKNIFLYFHIISVMKKINLVSEKIIRFFLAELNFKTLPYCLKFLYYCCSMSSELEKKNSSSILWSFFQSKNFKSADSIF